MRECQWRAGEIWLTLCDPSKGHEYRGTRPSLVIQHAFLPRTDGIITVMLMSSYKGRKWQHDILVKRDGTNRLSVDSLIKVQHIMSFDQDRLVKRIGIIDISTMSGVKTYIAKHFGLSP